MALEIWQERSGYSFGTFQERIPLELNLPVSPDAGVETFIGSRLIVDLGTFDNPRYSNIDLGTEFSESEYAYEFAAADKPIFIPPDGVTYELIAGSLPPGIRLSGAKIIGTPFEVPRPTTFTFCIRATSIDGIADRTFDLTIEGADLPSFQTAAGDLPLGPNNAYYVLDSSFVDFQLDSVDFDTAAGQRLHFFIANDDGDLPPGLTLNGDGRITGLVEPATIIKKSDGDGSYDSGPYDAVVYDFGSRPSDGYDSYVYDIVTYDYNIPTNTPTRVNRNYEFIVSLSDGDTVRQRKFKIFVVADDYFRADNVLLPASAGIFKADGTFLRNPIWKTDAYIGQYRANNYLTLMLDIYSTIDTGLVSYGIEATNFYDADLSYQIDDKVLFNDKTYICIKNNSLSVDTPDLDSEHWIQSKVPSGLSFDISTGELFGVVPYQPAVTKQYVFNVLATRYSNTLETSYSSRTFTIDLIGEIDSTIYWLTDSNLGDLAANYTSNLKVEASTSVVGAILVYSIESGILPPGLTLSTDGEIIGKVNQYSSIDKLGLTRFYDQSGVEIIYTTFDQDTTTVDRSYAFTIKAKDQYNYSAITKEFHVTITTPNNKLYSNLTVRPFMPLAQRTVFKSFITNNIVFTAGSIYRPNDPEFGIQTQLKMLAYAGIETREAAVYVSAIGLNHKKKQFKFGEVKKAVAKKPGTNTVLYEVVYIEMFDPLEPNGLRLNNKLIDKSKDQNKITIDATNDFWSLNLDTLEEDNFFSGRRPIPSISIDQTNIQVSDPNTRAIFPSSISNWQDRIKNWTDDDGVGLSTERNYLPLWMRSIQPESKQELGFILAIPICFCLPGKSTDILVNIKNYIKTTGFSFNKLDYTVDRYIIDSIADNTDGDKYLVFKNDRNTIT
jgi:hypothetical protein